MEDISVIIRNKNEERWIGHCIQSCLENFIAPEVIIVNHKSVDSSLEIAKSFRHDPSLKPSIKNAGLDPDNLPDADKSAMNFGSGGNTDSKAWKDIWGSGQGIGGIKDSPSVAELVGRIKSEYEQAFDEFKNRIQA